MTDRKTGYRYDLTDVDRGKKPPIMQVLDCSTAHITKADDDLLREHSIRETGQVYIPTAIATGYGYFVHVVLSDNRQDYIEAFKIHGYSDAFCKVIQYAAKHNCAWIKFDCDGFTIRGLGTFNW